jgi:hypothetical protein
LHSGPTAPLPGIAATFLAALLTGCDQWMSAEGRIVDRLDGTPVVHATVTFNGSHFPDSGIRVRTDEQGQFRVFENVAPGARLDSFTVEAADYPPTTFRPDVRGTTLPTVEVQLARPLYNPPSRLLVEFGERARP